jgi:cytochrome c-type biogenesis protein CcmH/NrfG
MQLKKACEEVEALLKSGKIDEAQKMASELETAYPERVELALLAGRTLLGQSRMRAATEAFSRAVTLDPLSAEAHYRLGFAAVQTGELERATKAWDTFIRLSPNGESRTLVNSALAAVRTLTQVLTKAAS